VQYCPDDSFNHNGSGIESDSLLTGPKESESHKHDFPGIGPALQRTYRFSDAARERLPSSSKTRHRRRRLEDEDEEEDDFLAAAAIGSRAEEEEELGGGADRFRCSRDEREDSKISPSRSPSSPFRRHSERAENRETRLVNQTQRLLTVITGRDLLYRARGISQLLF
jgi:hypothetical protein